MNEDETIAYLSTIKRLSIILRHVYRNLKLNQVEEWQDCDKQQKFQTLFERRNSRGGLPSVDADWLVAYSGTGG